jgi:hypothetical protein
VRSPRCFSMRTRKNRAYVAVRCNSTLCGVVRNRQSAWFEPAHPIITELNERSRRFSSIEVARLWNPREALRKPSSYCREPPRVFVRTHKDRDFQKGQFRSGCKPVLAKEDQARPNKRDPSRLAWRSSARAGPVGVAAIELLGQPKASCCYAKPSAPGLAMTPIHLGPINHPPATVRRRPRAAPGPVNAPRAAKFHDARPSSRAIRRACRFRPSF